MWLTWLSQPVDSTLDDSTQYLLVDDWTGKDVQPVHVAAVSQHALGILNESLTHVRDSIHCFILGF